MKTIKGTLTVLCIVSIVSSIMYAGTLSGASASISPNPMNVSAIKGLVYYDGNLDGKYQIWEHGIPGITINLLDANGSKTDKRITDANGFFLFNDVTPGKYIVSEDVPANLTNTSPANILVDLPRNMTVGVCIGNRNTTPTPTPTTTPTPTPTTTPTPTPTTTPTPTPTTTPTPTPTITPTPTPTTTPTPTPSPSVSPRTIGYWKNHQNNIGPFLPIYLGTVGGPRTTNVTTVFQAIYILNQHDPSNGIDKLKAQLLAAKLNIANGADGSSIAGTIAAADSFLATHAEPAWSSLGSTDQQYVLALKDALDTYNNVI